jgi:hypothetical protein
MAGAGSGELIARTRMTMDPTIDRIIKDLQRKRQELDDSSPRLDTSDILARIEALQNRMKQTPRITFRKKDP